MPRPPKSVFYWLVLVYLMIAAMVVVGGVTRLTGSGLSMVEWHPLMGALPPMGEEAWQTVFAKYQLSPQYSLVNHWMELADFKRIFFWEYFHRLLGRLIGVVVFVPWVYFAIRKRLVGRWLLNTGLAFVLGGLQGGLGWYMVRSGLVDLPHVSHLRLAAHLGLAFVLGGWIFWMAMASRAPSKGAANVAVRRLAWAFLALLAVQILWGAFMAGSRAGYLYNTFPDINGAFAPSGLLSMSPISDPPAIHFYHRLLGWLCLGSGLGLCVWARARSSGEAQRRAVSVMGSVLVLQFILGAGTVLLNVAIPIAAAHQLFAFALMSANLRLLKTFSESNDGSHRPDPAVLQISHK